jgi:UrcA family protein
MTANPFIRCTALLLVAASCFPALAEDALPSTTVRFGDLNLKSQEGVAALYRRIERAAVEVCDMPQGTLQLRIESELKSCRADATDRAIVQANLPKLSALHLAKTGRNVGNAQYAGRR